MFYSTSSGFNIFNLIILEYIPVLYLNSELMLALLSNA